MGKSDSELAAGKKAYRSAKEVGNRREEARWANVIGDILKNRGQYVEAIRWLRIDYEISSNYLPEKDLLPTCQCLGELFLRLHDFEEALKFQKEHLQRAKDSDDLVEQQRANTQLGRTYHELFFKTEDHSALHKAKKHFNHAMILARSLKETPPDSKSSFLKEYIDAYNNIGMLDMDLDNLEAAEKMLNKGLKICDEEEVSDNDDGRTRLHHNLGFVYTKLRMWNLAMDHTTKDIQICKNIGHRQGEAKGYINLGELCCKTQKFDEAIRSYQKALELARSMEDEDALATQARDNIQVVKEFMKVMEDIKKDEQNLKKLSRSMTMATGSSRERKSLRELMKSLDRLLEKTVVVSAWSKHLKFAKMKKKIAAGLCDQEKLGDSYLVVGESYQNLRKFQKARKWYTKSWDTYKTIGNLEGQAIAKINMGDILDAEGDWFGALKTFEEGYRIAVQAKKPSLQLLALENMHYSQMMRFDNAEEAKKLKLQIDDLKILTSCEQDQHFVPGDSCSETESEGNDSISRVRSGESESSLSTGLFPKAKRVCSIDDDEDDEALISLIRCDKLQKLERNREGKVERFSSATKTSTQSLSKSFDSPSRASGRKRARLVLSDDEDELECSNRKPDTNPLEDVATSNEFVNTRSVLPDVANDLQSLMSDDLKHVNGSWNPVSLEESSCSFKSTPSEGAACRNPKSAAPDKCYIKMRVEDVTVYIKAESSVFTNELDIKTLKIQAACSYFLQQSSERSSGLLPIIGDLKLREKVLESSDALETALINTEGGYMEASINGWVQKRLIEKYVEFCRKSSEAVNMKLLMKLYNLEVSEDEVIVSDCNLQDKSVVPLLKALHEHKTIAMLDVSHNMLGNGMMEGLVTALASGQKYGAFVLDMHCNTIGPTALFQICECPVLINRLEVLNISGNRLTDACGTYLSTILRSCKALYSLNIERCSVTSRTIQTIADSLDSSSVLSQLSVGYNNPISCSSLANLLGKLAKLERFSEVSLSGLKLNKSALDSICQLAQASCLSGLMLEATNIGSAGALQLTNSLFHETQELVKLNLSYCQLTPNYFDVLKSHTSAFCNILELNLAGNSITPQGGRALASLLANHLCSVKVLVLNKCGLGLYGITQIIKPLIENDALEELYLAGNIKKEECQHEEIGTLVKKLSEPILDNEQRTPVVNVQEGSIEDVNFNQWQVADSYDNDLKAENEESGLVDCATSQEQRNALQSENQSIEELCTGISNAKHLQILDLSDNGFSAQAIDAFCNAWSAGTRSGSSRKHVKDQTFHLYVVGKKCCGLRPCCRKD